MKKLLIVLVLLSGCAGETDKRPQSLSGDELTVFLANHDARREFNKTMDMLTMGFIVGILLSFGAWSAFLSYQTKQPYNGMMGKLDGWNEQLESVKPRAKSKLSKLQDSFSLEGKKDENNNDK